MWKCFVIMWYHYQNHLRDNIIMCLFDRAICVLKSRYNGLQNQKTR